MSPEDKLQAAFQSAHATDEEKRKALYRVDMHRKTTGRRRITAFVQAACAGAACVFGLVCFNIYRSETAYISLDVNPSISLAINDYGRVIEATGYNASSSEILETVHVDGRTYEEAVREVISTPGMQYYLTENPTVWIAVQARSPLREAEMERSVLAAAEGALAESVQGVSVEARSVSEEVRITAEDAGVSATRYVAIAELQEVDPGASIDSYRDAPIPAIHEQTAAHHAQASADHDEEHVLVPEDTQAEQPPAPAAEEPAVQEPPEQAAAPDSAATAGGHGHGYHHGYGHHD